VNVVTNLHVPKNVGKFLHDWGSDGFSRRAQLHSAKHKVACNETVFLSFYIF
jgi:hypothetical protein